jgi:gluconokinase
VIVMGVSGTGKTTVAKALSAAVGWTFEEGDSLHPQANIDKMSRGEPLTDADRAPWLAAIGRWIDRQAAKSEPSILTCSALKRAYRDELRAGRPQVRFVFLTGPRQLILERMEHRKDHFMRPEMLDSQLRTLEPPTPDEHAIVVDVDADTAEEVAQIRRALEI